MDSNPNMTRKFKPDQTMGQNDKNEVPKDTQEKSDTNVTNSTRSSDMTVAPKVDNDETEYSSSFGDIASESEKYSGLSDSEVDSAELFTSPIYGFTNAFPMRKKEVTEKWRNYIRPLLWRCKWAELKAKRCQAIAAKYEKELAELEKMEQNATTEEGTYSRTIPFEFHGKRNMLMKRRKRKRSEHTTDVNLYMDNHNLFSYFKHIKEDVDGDSLYNNSINAVIEERNTPTSDYNNNDWLFVQNNITKEEETLMEIESIQSRVRKMKVQLDLINTTYASKFSSLDSLIHLVPDDVHESPIPSPNLSISNADNNVSGPADFACLLSSVDVTKNSTEVLNSSKKSLENITMENSVGNHGVVDVVGKRMRKNNNPCEEKNQDSDNNIS